MTRRDPHGPRSVTASGDAREREEVASFLARADEASFRLLYRRHTPLLYALALRLARGAPAEAEDVVQETWIRAIAGLHGFRRESSFSTWLCGIAIRCARELARRRPENAGDQPDAFTSRAASSEEQLDLERAVASLPSGYREILLLHDVHGYTHEEIASLLSIEPGTSKSQLSRARRAARQRLQTGDPPARDQENLR